MRPAPDAHPAAPATMQSAAMRRSGAMTPPSRRRRRMAAAPVLNTNQPAQLFQARGADAVNLGELVDAGEFAVGISPGHDGGRGHRPDTGQGIQLLRRR